MANIARTYLIEGQTEKALKISLALRQCPTEIKIVQDEIDCLLADLKAVLPEGQMEAAIKQVAGKISLDQVSADVLTYMQEHETG